MRIVFIGASEFGVVAARQLITAGHEVVIVEVSRARIDELTDHLDCSFVHGDGTRSDILREAGAGKADVLVCATDDDRTNVLASVVGRHLGFPRVVTIVEDIELESLGIELGLDQVVVPCRSVGAELRDAALGVPNIDTSSVLRDGLRLFPVAIGEHLAGRTAAEVTLPNSARALWAYRGARVVLIDPDTQFEIGDEVIVVGSTADAAGIASRFAPPGDSGAG